MAYSPGPLVKERLKPGPWNVEGAFVDPEFQGLWRDIAFVAPLWESSASSVFDFGAGRVGLLDNDGQGTLSPTWIATPGGSGLDFPGDAGNELDWGSDPLSFSSTDRYTVFTVFTYRGDGSGTQNNQGLFRSGSTSEGGYFWVISSEALGSELWGRHNSVNTPAEDDGPVLTVGERYAIARTWDGANVRQYVDGELRTTTAESTGSAWDVYRWGTQSSGGEALNAGVELIVFARRAWSDAEVSQISVDPFGLIRPNWDYITAAAGPSFPDAPTNLVADAVSTSQINLSWDAVTGAGGYDIERDSTIIVSDHQSTTYNDTGLNTGQSYDYRVRART